jgi:DNA-binding SARP family transcriptional activator
MNVRLDVFGGIRLAADDGREIAVARGKLTALLLVLAANRGQMVTLSRLVQALWGHEPPRTSTASLHNYVSSLRSVLAHASPGSQHRLRLVADGYQLDLEPHECDLIEFEQLATAGRAATRRGDMHEAVLLLRSALQLWPTDGVAGGDAATSSAMVDEMIQRWTHMALGVREDCLAAEIQLGRHADVVLELRELVAKHQLREQLYVLLMRALWMSGERAEALQVYQAARNKLVGELGLEPGPELTAMQASVLGGETPRPPLPVRPVIEPPRQLPVAIADFVGRESLVDSAIELLGHAGTVPTVCVSGQPGVGKTALAVHIGHLLAGQFPDGQLYVNLGGGRDRRAPQDVLGELLHALGVPDSAVPPGPGRASESPAATARPDAVPDAAVSDSGHPPAGADSHRTRTPAHDLERRAAAYRTRLAGRRVLVVLDDAADAEQVRPLLPGTAGSAVLVTARRMLTGLPAATAVALAPLTQGEAMTLLATILGADRLASDTDSAARLVDLCGRLPLAIRVVAARLATRPRWSMSSLVARMSVPHRLLDELSIGELDVRAGIAAAYAGLGAVEQAVFRRFALAGTSTLAPWAMAALGGGDDPDRSTDPAIHHLLSSHLIEPVTGRYEQYTMHDLVRAFALEEVRRSDGPTDEVGSAAHAAFRRLFDTTCALVRLAYRHMPDAPGWPAPAGAEPEIDLPAEVADTVRRDPMLWFAAEMRTLFTVLPVAAGLGWHREVLDAVDRVNGFLAVKHRLAEADELYRIVVAACGDDTWAAARAQFGLAQSRAVAGQIVEADEALSECAEVFRRTGDMQALVNCLVLLGACHAQLAELGMENVDTQGFTHEQVNG